MAKRKSRPSHRMLRIEAPQRPVRLEDLVRSSYSIGRGDPEQPDSVDFRIETDGAVSRLHCSLVKDAGGYVLRNHSDNGTEINGRLIQGRHLLKSKDVIRIGEDTRIEYLALTAADRRRAFEAIGEKARPEKTAEDDVRKGLLQQPWILGVLAFYAVIALVLLNAGGKKTRQSVPDPGKGPYFDWMIKEPLRVGKAVEVKDARARAEAMWAESVAEYGGDMVTEGGNAFRLLLRGRNVLRVLGYRTVTEANDKEEIAAQMLQIQTDLEARVALLYARMKDLRKTGPRSAEMRALLQKIMQTVPKSDDPLHRYAADWLWRIQPKKKSGGRRRRLRTLR